VQIHDGRGRRPHHDFFVAQDEGAMIKGSVVYADDLEWPGRFKRSSLNAMSAAPQTSMTTPCKVSGIRCFDVFDYSLHGRGRGYISRTNSSIMQFVLNIPREFRNVERSAFVGVDMLCDDPHNLWTGSTTSFFRTCLSGAPIFKRLVFGSAFDVALERLLRDPECFRRGAIVRPPKVPLSKG